MAGKIVLDVPDDPKLTLAISVSNGKAIPPTTCSFCAEPLVTRQSFMSEHKSGVAICADCVKKCFHALPQELDWLEAETLEKAQEQAEHNRHGNPMTQESITPDQESF